MLKLALVLHILGASVWTGGHLVLSLTVLPRALRHRDPDVIRNFEEGYERIGLPSLAIQIVTGLWLAHRLMPTWADWFSFTTIASTHVALKLLLLLLTVALALHARLRIIPRLSERTLPMLAWHVIAVTVLAVLFVLVGVGFRTGGLL
ncbi:MAG: CopD family protein [Gemmatimonadota bacterium]|nr:MAG: CopD family protein [Gemmatimonadota bacterium]